MRGTIQTFVWLVSVFPPTPATLHRPSKEKLPIPLNTAAEWIIDEKPKLPNVKQSLIAHN